MRKPVLALLIPAVLVTGLGLTGCSSRSRWCEYDATDKRVSDKFCKNHVPGYEWEYSSSHSHSHVKKHSTVKHYKTKTKTRKSRH